MAGNPWDVSRWTSARLSERFVLESQVAGPSLRLLAAGELDMAAAFDFESRVETLLQAEATRSVTLDLAGVDFVDSAGLGALVSVRERAQQLGVPLEIPRVSGPVQRLLDLTGVSDIVRAKRDPSDA